MPRRPRVIVKTEFYYSTDSESESDSDYESESDATTVIFSDDESGSEVSESESDATTVIFSDDESGSEDGTDYESETDVESDSEELDDPKPYYGKGFRVYFDSHADKKFFMQAFGFLDA